MSAWDKAIEENDKLRDATVVPHKRRKVGDVHAETPLAPRTMRQMVTTVTEEPSGATYSNRVRDKHSTFIENDSGHSDDASNDDNDEFGFSDNNYGADHVGGEQESSARSNPTPPGSRSLSLMFPDDSDDDNDNGNDGSLLPTDKSGAGVMRRRLESWTVNEFANKVVDVGREEFGDPMPPPPPPVGGFPTETIDHGSDADVCPVCSEQFRPLYETHKSVAAAVDAQAAGVKSTAKNANARSKMQGTASDRYGIIFTVDQALKGWLCDEQLLPLLLMLHKKTIEKPLRTFKIPFVPWTLPILKKHFDPRQRHVFDPVRSLVEDLKDVEREIRVLNLRQRSFGSTTSPAEFKMDNDNSTLKLRYLDKKNRLVKQLNDLLAKHDENKAAAIFALISAIKNVGNKDLQTQALMHDPKTAAGTLAAGGDMRNSAAHAGNNALGTAADFYNISGY